MTKWLQASLHKSRTRNTQVTAEDPRKIPLGLSLTELIPRFTDGHPDVGTRRWVL